MRDGRLDALAPGPLALEGLELGDLPERRVGSSRRSRHAPRHRDVATAAPAPSSATSSVDPDRLGDDSRPSRRRGRPRGPRPSRWPSWPRSAVRRRRQRPRSAAWPPGRRARASGHPSGRRRTRSLERGDRRPPIAATSTRVAHPLEQPRARASGSRRCPRRAGSGAGGGWPCSGSTPAGRRPVATPLWNAAGEDGHEGVVEAGWLDRLGDRTRLPAHRPASGRRPSDRMTTGGTWRLPVSRMRRPRSSPSMSGIRRSARTRRSAVAVADQRQRLGRRPRWPRLAPQRRAGRRGCGGWSSLSSTTSTAGRRGRPARARRRRPRRSAPVTRSARRKTLPCPGTPVLSAVERPAHSLGQATADGEAQAGPAEAPRDGRVRLAEHWNSRPIRSAGMPSPCRGRVEPPSPPASPIGLASTVSSTCPSR